MLEELKNQKVLLLCSAFYYAGVIKAVHLESVELEDAHIVYQTGDWSRNGDWEDAQKLPFKVFHVRRAAIESYGVLP